MKKKIIKKLFAAQKKAKGGRIGYRTGGDTAEVLGPVTPGKGLGDIDQGDFNLSDLGEYTQMYESEDKSALMKLITRLIKTGMSPGAAAMEAARMLGDRAQLRPEGIADLLQREGMPKGPAIPLPEPIRPEHPDDNFHNMPTWPRELAPEMKKKYQELLKNLPSGEDIKRFIPKGVLGSYAQGGRIGAQEGGLMEFRWHGKRL